MGGEYGEERHRMVRAMMNCDISGQTANR